MPRLNILIVEDEARMAKRVERLTREILPEDQINRIIIKENFFTAWDYIQQHAIDVLLLDLNLSEQDGMELLKTALAESFSTIIISANRAKAIEAFEFGVLDFVTKPFRKERLEKAWSRVLNPGLQRDFQSKYLAIKKSSSIHLVPIKDILYLKGANIYSEINLRNGTKELSDKSLESIFQLFPPHFARIHKSYIANMEEAASLLTKPGSKYELQMKNGLYLPVGRTRYKQIKASFFNYS